MQELSARVITNLLQKTYKNQQQIVLLKITCQIYVKTFIERQQQINRWQKRRAEINKNQLKKNFKQRIDCKNQQNSINCETQQQRQQSKNQRHAPITNTNSKKVTVKMK